MKDTRICYIGDSFVNGTGDSTMLGWTARVSEMSQNKFREITHYNLGIRRETTSDILKRWEKESSIRFRDDSENYMVFSFGVNDSVILDGVARVSIDESIKNAKMILTQAKKEHPTLMIGPPCIDDIEVNKGIRLRDKAYMELCIELDIPYISIYKLTIENEIWRAEVSSNDGAHPKEKGYKLLAEYIFFHDNWLLK